MTDTVGVRDLRQNLSRYLDEAKRGKRMIVTERNRPVAELGPLSVTGLDRLVAEGRATPPRSRPVFTPVELRGRGRAGSDALEFVRGERG